MDTFTMFLLYTATVVLLVTLYGSCVVIYTQDYTPRYVLYTLFVGSAVLLGASVKLLTVANGEVNIALHNLSGICAGMVLVKIMITHSKR